MVSEPSCCQAVSVGTVIYIMRKGYSCASPNDDLFDRLETVRFFRLFTGEGDMEDTGRGNTEHRGLKARVLP